FMVDGLLFAGFRLRQSDSQLKPPPPSISRLNSPVHQIRAYLLPVSPAAQVWPPLHETMRKQAGLRTSTV
ncbi:hypothetical protein VOM14_28760, partial [Paraburkholderia sp. MPAMCS5]|uniref:hypothetical protein n=1 Tax=Paraburkholderia sp. MPAMCS5 TaxID=3112563 RepID=UPI002E19B066|nr:hypothetical protein [Paraburkholderia sp. MPAMCS5]